MAKKAKKAKSKTKKGKMGKKSAPARKKKGVVAKKSDKLYETVKREIGKFNIGLYCTSCSEFFALAVVDDARKGELIPIKSVGTPLFECPFCHHQQRRQVSEIAIGSGIAFGAGDDVDGRRANTEAYGAEPKAGRSPDELGPRRRRLDDRRPTLT